MQDPAVIFFVKPPQPFKYLKRTQTTPIPIRTKLYSVCRQRNLRNIKSLAAKKFTNFGRTNTSNAIIIPPSLL